MKKERCLTAPPTVVQQFGWLDRNAQLRNLYSIQSLYMLKWSSATSRAGNSKTHWKGATPSEDCNLYSNRA